MQNGTRVKVVEYVDERMVGMEGTVVMEPFNDDDPYWEVRLDSAPNVERPWETEFLFFRQELEYLDVTEFWMLDYLNAVFPQYGLFESEDAAWQWVDENHPEADRTSYKPFKITVNKNIAPEVPTTSPFRRYVNQR